MYVQGWTFKVLSPIFAIHWGLQTVKSRPEWRRRQIDQNYLRFKSFEHEVWVRYGKIQKDKSIEHLLSVLLKLEENGEKEKRYWLKSTMRQTNNGEQISIGTDFDYTNELFRHTLPVFDSSPNFLIRFPEKTVEIKNVSVLWMSPSQKIVAVQRYSNLKAKEGWKLIDIPEKQLNNGLWALIYINGSDEVCILEYLILNEFENIPEDNVELKKTEFDAIKSIIGQKSKDTKSWIESTFEFQDFCEVGSTCEKSNLTGVQNLKNIP